MHTSVNRTDFVAAQDLSTAVSCDPLDFHTHPRRTRGESLQMFKMVLLVAVFCITVPVSNLNAAAAKATIGFSQFSPANGALNMPISGITLSWFAGTGAVSHDIYLDTVNPPAAFQGNQSGTSFPLTAALTPNTTYYWRIDEKDGSGATTTGDLWSFTTGAPVGIYPYLTWRNNPADSIVVNWWNPAAKGDSSVDYGLTASYASTVNLPVLVNFHHVELTGLAAGTTYHYRIRSSDGTVGSDNTFTTAPQANTNSFRFAYYGDPRGTEFEDQPYYTRHEALCDWIAAQDVDFAIEGGDTVWEGATLRSMGKYWPDFFNLESNLTKSKVVMHTMGGHDVQGGTYYYWNDFYTDAYPNTNAAIASNNGRVYSFDYANAHFVCLASYQVNLGQQAAWLDADLAAARARGMKWLFVWLHDPLFTTSGHPNRTACIQAWGPIFDKYRVDVVFQAHNHLYERFRPLTTYYDDVNSVWTGRIVPDGQGTVYVTNGAGGAEFNNGDSSDPKLVCWFGASNLNATVVTIVETADIQAFDSMFPIRSCRVRAIRNDTGQVIDSFEIIQRLLPADLNKDGVIDTLDLAILAGNWLDSGMWP